MNASLRFALALAAGAQVVLLVPLACGLDAVGSADLVAPPDRLEPTVGDSAPDGESPDAGIDAADAAAFTTAVLAEDTLLVRPAVTGPVYASIVGYDDKSACPFTPTAKCELPQFAPYDRDTDAFWDNLVEELIHSRVHVAMLTSRGCLDPAVGNVGAGDMCPRLLSRFVAAVDRAGARDVIRVGMWDDAPWHQETRNVVDGLPSGTLFDLADLTSWRFFWDHGIEIWFDTIPKDLWYRMGGRPVVGFWTLSNAYFTNQAGNARLLLQDLRAKFLARYGEDPLFEVTQTWLTDDPTITTGDVAGVNDWFGPPGNNYTYKDFGGKRWGVAVPGFRDPDTLAGCGTSCREVGRADGVALRAALAAGANATLTLLPGWTDVAESSGYYRSAAWRYPNQYINIVREFADTETRTLRFQAEAADDVSDTSPSNEGGSYRQGPLDVGTLPGEPGWFVGWTKPGEWLRFREVQLACGVYRFTARIAANTAGQTIHLDVDGVSAGEVTVQNTGAWSKYELVHLGAQALAAGPHELKLTFDTGAVNLDWFFARRAVDCTQ